MSANSWTQAPDPDFVAQHPARRWSDKLPRTVPCNAITLKIPSSVLHQYDIRDVRPANERKAPPRPYTIDPTTGKARPTRKLRSRKRKAADISEDVVESVDSAATETRPAKRQHRSVDGIVHATQQSDTIPGLHGLISHNAIISDGQDNYGLSQQDIQMGLAESMGTSVLVDRNDIPDPGLFDESVLWQDDAENDKENVPALPMLGTSHWQPTQFGHGMPSNPPFNFVDYHTFPGINEAGVNSLAQADNIYQLTRDAIAQQHIPSYHSVQAGNIGADPAAAVNTNQVGTDLGFGFANTGVANQHVTQSDTFNWSQASNVHQSGAYAPSQQQFGATHQAANNNIQPGEAFGTASHSTFNFFNQSSQLPATSSIPPVPQYVVQAQSTSNSNSNPLLDSLTQPNEFDREFEEYGIRTPSPPPVINYQAAYTTSAYSLVQDNMSQIVFCRNHTRMQHRQAVMYGTHQPADRENFYGSVAACDDCRELNAPAYVNPRTGVLRQIDEAAFGHTGWAWTYPSDPTLAPAAMGDDEMIFGQGDLNFAGYSLPTEPVNFPDYEDEFDGEEAFGDGVGQEDDNIVQSIEQDEPMQEQPIVPQAHLANHNSEIITSPEYFDVEAANAALEEYEANHPLLEMTEDERDEFRWRYISTGCRGRAWLRANTRTKKSDSRQGICIHAYFERKAREESRGRYVAIDDERFAVAGVADRLHKDVELSAVDGLKVNRNGTVLDDESAIVAYLVNGDKDMCTGQVVNERGQVLDDAGEVIGNVVVGRQNNSISAIGAFELHSAGSNGQLGVHVDRVVVRSVQNLGIRREGKWLANRKEFHVGHGTGEHWKTVEEWKEILRTGGKDLDEDVREVLGLNNLSRNGELSERKIKELLADKIVYLGEDDEEDDMNGLFGIGEYQDNGPYGEAADMDVN